MGGTPKIAMLHRYAYRKTTGDGTKCQCRLRRPGRDRVRNAPVRALPPSEAVDGHGATAPALFQRASANALVGHSPCLSLTDASRPSLAEQDDGGCASRTVVPKGIHFDIVRRRSAPIGAAPRYALLGEPAQRTRSAARTRRSSTTGCEAPPFRATVSQVASSK